MTTAKVQKKQKKYKLGAYEIPLHLMLIPGIIITILFHYVPLGGLVIAFQRFIPAKGLFGNQKWVGMDNFEYIFSMPNTLNVLRNTVTIAFWKIHNNTFIPKITAISHTMNKTTIPFISAQARVSLIQIMI